MEDRDLFVDRLLDAGLNRLKNHEPLPGVEDRILAQLRSEPKHAFRFDLGWKSAAALAGVTIAATAAYVYLSIWRVSALAPSKSVVIVYARAAAPQIMAKLRNTTERSAERLKKHRRIRGVNNQHEPQLATAEPHLPVFPTPTPLSEEEKLLLQYAQYAPPPDPSIFDDGLPPLAQNQIEPLEIAPPKLVSLKSRSDSKPLGRN